MDLKMYARLTFAACILLAAAPLAVGAQDSLQTESSPAQPAPVAGQAPPQSLQPPREDGSASRRGVSPNIILDLPLSAQPNEPPRASAPAILEQIGACHRAGIQFFAECLRHRHSVIEIRRLEACVGSETIPDRSDKVRNCLAAGQW